MGMKPLTPGTWALQPGGKSSNNPNPPTGNRLITRKQLELPNVSGLTIRARPFWFGTDPRKPDTSFIDACLKTSRAANKPAKLLVMSGPLPDSVLSAAKLKVHGYPVPWDEPTQSYWQALITALGQKYNGQADIQVFHFPGMTDFDTSEEHYKDENWKYSIKQMVGAFEKQFTYLEAAWDATHIHFAVGANAEYTPQIIDVGANCLQQGQLLVGMNALKSNVSMTWKGVTYVTQGIQRNANRQVGMRLEMVSATRDDLNGKPRAGSRNINDSIAAGKTIAKKAGLNPQSILIDTYGPDLAALKPW